MSDSMIIKSLFRDYKVKYGGSFIPTLKNYVDNNSFFIVDASVWVIYADRIMNIIPKERLIIFDAVEKNKSLDKCQSLIETLVEKKVRRNEHIVAVGGGITQDITAFSASIIYRGIEWSFIPTTLLAQADSCIGSKTSINLGDKKNLIGNFYPPTDIFIDTIFLDSLSVEDIKSGIGEILHYYLYAASPLFDELIGNYAMVIKERNLLIKYVQESLKIKKSVIEKDEFDRRERNLFNYGHTFGHAIESVTDYAIKHGQAVTIGMDLANYISVRLKFMSPNIFLDLHEKLSTNFPEYKYNNINIDKYLVLLSKDKKNEGNNIGCILAKKTGDLFKIQLKIDDYLKEIICEYFSGQVINKK